MNRIPQNQQKTAVKKRLQFPLQHAGNFYKIRITAGDLCINGFFFAVCCAEIPRIMFFCAAWTSGFISFRWPGTREMLAEIRKTHHTRSFPSLHAQEHKERCRFFTGFFFGFSFFYLGSYNCYFSHFPICVSFLKKQSRFFLPDYPVSCTCEYLFHMLFPALFVRNTNPGYLMVPEPAEFSIVCDEIPGSIGHLPHLSFIFV